MSVSVTTEDGGRTVVLALQAITKRFGNTVALGDVSFTVRSGSVHALLGENGAGKTTLMRAAFGLIGVDQGSVRVAGASRVVRSAADAISAGVGMVHQHFTNVAAMSVAENVALGGRGRFDAQRARQRVIEIGDRTGLVLDPKAMAGELSVGAQQRLEIVKALARDARVLIMDEPTAVLAPAEAEELMRWLRNFANDGNAVVLITHKLAEAIAIADEVTVLRHGRVVLNEIASRVSIHSLAAAMLGDDPPRETRTTRTVTGRVVVAARGVEIGDEREDGGTNQTPRTFSVEVHAGEIMGIAGVEGAGQHSLLRTLAARRQSAGGALQLPSKIGFVPEDRQRDALVLDFSAMENVALNGIGSARGTVAWGAVAERTTRLIHDFDVRGGGAQASVRALSGGNQQKLILARELDGAPDLLVVENPTRGLDIRAAREVRERLRSAAAEGTAVVVYSSDLDEVLSLATRVLVMHAGELREVAGDRETVGRAMLGVA